LLLSIAAVKVDFYIPQLITMYVNNYNRVADALHPYLFARCRDSHFFSLRCYWLLEAYGGVAERAPHAHALLQAILRDFLPFRPGSSKAQSRAKREELKALQAAATLAGTLSLNGHHRSQSDARIDSSFMAGEEVSGVMHRTAGSSSSLATVGSSQPGRGNHPSSVGQRGSGCNAQLGGDTVIFGILKFLKNQIPNSEFPTTPQPARIRQLPPPDRSAAERPLHCQGGALQAVNLRTIHS